jgi:hypothetical protein
LAEFKDPKINRRLTVVDYVARPQGWPWCLTWPS